MTTIVFRNSPLTPGEILRDAGRDDSFRCSLAALTEHFPSGTLASRAREAVNRATGERAPREVELHLASEPDALRAALHAYTTGSLQGAQLPASADLDWIQTEVIQKYGIPLGVAALLERPPKASRVGNGGGARAVGVGSALDAGLLRIYFAAKAEPAAKDIIAMLSLDVAAIMDSALFIVSSIAPEVPESYEWKYRHGWSHEQDDDDYDFDVPAPDEAAPKELFVSRIAGAGKPLSVVKQGFGFEGAFGVYWVVDPCGRSLHANLLSGALPRATLQAVAAAVVKLQPSLKASVESFKAEGEAPSGLEAHTALLLRVSWPSAF
ncbi:hypothetical protein HYH03_012877 [Edaphochlamys debaryana]|uniref:Uncharacterized protein n=1 Tax=Edaphochlamys debaryana TaxID=47281 RepID=A0A835XT75_9CHLO|nr:hypothetical protein HYH03_012877 [Edaphochlamys debaryana]|eukprot:KAG2488558.1 hypothetical protein HYH03_012877 [Edaphochlamys debaryana]